MRAPSTDLLRALRRAAATTSSPVVYTSRAAQLRCHQVSPSQPQTHLRALSTNPAYHQQSPARPPSVPPPTSTARSLNIPPRPTAPPPNPARPGSPRINPYAPSKSRDRGPASKEETQTDFSKLDIYASAGVEEPATSIDACTHDGFHLNNGVQTSGGRGVMLVGGEGFVWSPWAGTGAGVGDATVVSSTPPASGKERRAPTASQFSQFLNARSSVLDFPPSAFGLLTLLYPKPDLLIFGTGRQLHMLSKDTRRYLSEELGMKVDVMDTANAAAAYNLLVMERGVEGVGAILIPEGFV
ncbi:hypothetical protein G647_09024 [Cladophialophora carrionii CBS 160.54]|uniref:NADH dehydrogenase [ubiquinone] 1 alpha subcomplex assembly factor 3 n=1 Tax=Cladophialophora carrionii CBS 160.54 TaxID=1279043 RepID=V9CZC9_9EURO|nr:uncharacterized protein G647_09024 [Cladophialophora carrionii CBS 160.54]ETI20009.1 hypothetical protein G647_09024 [Cladophialophora carrionii CBS 160.54]